ncbi:MAG: hypothetical protein ABW148_13260 [Sedimenticola sp.]
MEAEGETIATHQRRFEREEHIFYPWHYLPILERKPGALRNDAPFHDWDLPGPITRVKQHMLKQPKGDHAFVQILLALHDHGSELLIVACEVALEHCTVSAAVVLNHFHRLNAPTQFRSLPVADNLTLTN